MKNIRIFIAEKLHLNNDNKDNLRSQCPIEQFIDSFSENEKPHIVKLINYCISDCTTYDTNIEPYPRYILKKESGGKILYLWTSNGYREKLNVGDTTKLGSTVIFIIKPGDELPRKYEKYLELT